MGITFYEEHNVVLRQLFNWSFLEIEIYSISKVSGFCIPVGPGYVENMLVNLHFALTCYAEGK